MRKLSLGLLVALFCLGSVATAARAQEEEKLGPGWFSLDSSVGVVDHEIQKGKKALEEHLFGIQISGYLETTYTWASSKPEGPISLRSFILDQNKVTFNAFNMTLELPKEKGPWGFGFRLAGLFGRTGELLRESTFWGPSLVGEPSAELFEAYITRTIPIGNGIDFLGGLFLTTLGKEVVNIPGNYNENITRSFLFGFAEPARHLGGNFSYAFTDAIAVNLGIVTGWDSPYDRNGAPSVLGGLTFTPTKNFNYTFQAIWGPEQDQSSGPKRWLITNVFNYTVRPELTFSADAAVGGETGVGANGSDVFWAGLAGYVTYDWTDRFSTSFRGEWFQDHDGTQTGGGASGIQDEVNLGEITLTLAYQFTKQLLGRWEVRQDWADRAVFREGRNGLTSNQTQVSLQGIYTF